jgi:hypothetical protein
LNLREIFQLKDDKINTLESKLSAIEEENINLQKRIYELEQKSNTVSNLNTELSSKANLKSNNENLPFSFSKYKQPSSRGDNMSNIFNTEKELNYIKSVQQKYLTGKYGTIISPVSGGQEIRSEHKLKDKSEREAESFEHQSEAKFYKPANEYKVEYTFSKTNEGGRQLSNEFKFVDNNEIGKRIEFNTDKKLNENKLASHTYDLPKQNAGRNNFTDLKGPELKSIENYQCDTVEGKAESTKPVENIYSPINNSLNSRSENENRNEIKDFLMTVKGKVDSQRFKEFIKYIKILTNKDMNSDRNDIFIKVKELFGNNRELYEKFERIIVFKK